LIYNNNNNYNANIMSIAHSSLTNFTIIIYISITLFSWEYLVSCIFIVEIILKLFRLKTIFINMYWIILFKSNVVVHFNSNLKTIQHKMIKQIIILSLNSYLMKKCYLVTVDWLRIKISENVLILTIKKIKKKKIIKLY
jgi:hypothetical protein